MQIIPVVGSIKSPRHCVEEASFTSICPIASIFQVCVYPLSWLSPLTDPLINNEVSKIFSTCSFYICMKVMILHFFEKYLLILLLHC